MISIIVAVANGGVIGGGNALLWHISEDLQRFKAITSGHPIIMGRKTYESIGRPLPNRTNVVITRNPAFNAAGCAVVGSLGEAIALFPDEQEIFVIGGGEIYRQALPLAEKLYVTHVKADYEGDTYFPTIDSAEWHATHSESFSRGAKFPHPYEYVNYARTTEKERIIIASI